MPVCTGYSQRGMMKRSYREFLPAVLEIQDTPPSPAGRFILWGVMLLLTLSVCWAALGQVDIVAITRGKVVVTLLSRPVSSAVTADIARVYVQDGQHVEKGSILIQLNDGQLTTRRQENRLRQQINRLNIRRLGLLLMRVRNDPLSTDRLADGITSDVAPPLENQVSARQEAEAEALRREIQRYRNNQQTLHAQMEGYLAQQDMAEKQLVIYRKQFAALQSLFQRGSTSEDSLLEVRKRLLEADYSARAAGAKVREIQASLDLSESEEASYRAGKIQEWEQERTELVTENAVLESQLAQLEAELKLYQLTAPVSGRVDALVYRDAGAAVEATQELLKIVPEGEKLSAEVLVSNQDVGFLHTGQRVTVKVDTFDFTRYGWVEGTLIKVSADAVEDKERGLLYRAVIQLDETDMVVDGKSRRLEPGMSVSAEIKTGKRTILSYLLSPVLEAIDGVGKQR
ncbi:HlyD family type I secretion periplasmic adaptor subunit [Salmonella enterica subsp. enterica serovar Napoli]|nr:HlyD family type I secretion periplasmic adaptor subunit [Salmonella enterica subsp. enterica serovar Napoli]